MTRRPPTRLVASVASALLLLAGIGAPARAHVVGCARTDAPGGDWPMFGQNLTGDRVQSGEFYLNAQKAPLLQPVWTFDADRWTHQRNNEVTGYPIEADGCVFVGSSIGNDAAGNHVPGWVFALNADNGDVVWQTKIDGAGNADARPGGGVYSTVAVSNGVVYAFVSHVGDPYLVALSEQTGAVLWQTVVDHQVGSDAVSSPVVFDGMVWVGVSGTAAEGDAADRTSFEGNTVLVAAQPIDAPEFAGPESSGPATGSLKHYEPGEIVRKLYTIPPSEWTKDGVSYAGGSQWGTISIDPQDGYGYEGTGNPFSYHAEHANTNAVLKIDLDRSRSTFGQIVGSYKGDIEEYFPNLTNTVPCQEVEDVGGFFGAGTECAHLDLDFGATPNVYTDATGLKIVSAGQKSGVVHFFDAATMGKTFSQKVLLGAPSAVGGMVGSAAFDGRTLYGPHTIGGYLWAIDANTRTPAWVTPTADGVHWGPPVTYANHVLYTVDLKGFLDVYDAGSGAPLLHRPLQLGSDTATLTNPPLSWGGVTVARNTVYASVGLGLSSAGAGFPSMPDGFVIAFKPLVVPAP